MNVVDVTVSDAETLTPSSFYRKIRRLSQLDGNHKSRTLQIYVEKGKFTAEEITTFKNKIENHMKLNKTKNVTVLIDEIE